jgi:hypothetical protein
MEQTRSLMRQQHTNVIIFNSQVVVGQQQRATIAVVTSFGKQLSWSEYVESPGNKLQRGKLTSTATEEPYFGAGATV